LGLNSYNTYSSIFYFACLRSLSLKCIIAVSIWSVEAEEVASCVDSFGWFVDFWCDAVFIDADIVAAVISVADIAIAIAIATMLLF
jgi:hypothetical protein